MTSIKALLDSFIKDPKELGIDTFSPSTFKNNNLVPQLSKMTSLVP